MSSKRIYQALINGVTTLDVTQDDLDALDLSVRDEAHMHVISGTRSMRVEVVNADYASRSFVLKIGEQRVEVSLKDDVELQVTSMGFERNSKKHINDIVAPMPGLVLDVRVSAGDQVSEGSPLVILEAMKMENELTAPRDGTVAKVLANKGDTVDKAQVLVVLD